MKTILNYLLDENYNHIGCILIDENKVIKEVYFHDSDFDLSGVVSANNAKWLNKITKPSAIQNRDIKNAISLSSEVVLYHGTKDKDLIPVFGKGRKEND